jgi:adenylate cyclase
MILVCRISSAYAASPNQTTANVDKVPFRLPPAARLRFSFTVLILTFLDAGLPRVHRLREGDNIVIGRAANCELVISAKEMSRQHARLRVAGAKITLEDLGSTCGTFVNDKRISGAHQLNSGDSFTLAAVAITLTSDVNEIDLDDGHVVIDEARSIVRSMVPMDAPAPAAAADAPAADRRSDRRSRIDRRIRNVGRPAGERRSGRDRRGGRILRLLAEIGNTLVRTQPLEQVLDRVVRLVFDVIPAERAFLLLRDAPDEPLTARVQRNRDGTTPAKTTLSHTIVNKVMRERVAISAKDALYDPRLGSAGSIQLMNIRSFMCAPLWNRGEVLGVLYCDNPKTKQFNEDDLEVFAALCNYAAVAIEQSRLTAQLTEETRRRERLQRYHSPAVINKILHGEEAGAGLVAQTRDVSVMFCDIAGFTTLTQHMTPEAVGEMLNEFFERMTDIIFEHDGTLDKFIGDAILAVFGAPFEQPDHASRAVAAAIEMRQELVRLNAEHPDRPIRMRTAINSGPALAGDIGSPRRREFTVLGDVVNTASRIESSVAQPGQIVISQFTKDRLRPGFNSRQLDSVTLRGRDSALDVFEVIE